MNLFHMAFNYNLKSLNRTALDDAFIRTVSGILNRRVSLERSIIVGDPNSMQYAITPYRHRGGDVANKLRELVIEAIKDTGIQRDGKKEPEVRVVYECVGPNNSRAIAIIDVKFQLTARTKFHYRARVNIDENSFMHNNFEWEKKRFPAAATSDPKFPTIILTKDDLMGMLTTECGMRDFAVTAIREGWNNVQLHPEQLVLTRTHFATQGLSS